MYCVAWKIFSTFSESRHISSSNLSVENIIDFIAWLSIKGYASSSVKSYISAISFRCKMANTCDVTDNFIVKKLLTGLSRLDIRKDVRMPITHETLTKIILALPAICFSNFEAILFGAIFTIAFYGFLRVGELVPQNNSILGHALLKHNISYLPHLNVIEIFLPHSKNDQDGLGITLCIPATSNVTCPVKAFLAYSAIRPNFPGLFFRHLSGSNVSRYQFLAVLKKALSSAGVNSSLYKSHSFRIGAATSAALAGLSGDEVSFCGRWKSNSYKKYIRIPTIALAKC